MRLEAPQLEGWTCCFPEMGKDGGIMLYSIYYLVTLRKVIFYMEEILIEWAYKHGTRTKVSCQEH